MFIFEHFQIIFIILFIVLIFNLSNGEIAKKLLNWMRKITLEADYEKCKIISIAKNTQWLQRHVTLLVKLIAYYLQSCSHIHSKFWFWFRDKLEQFFLSISCYASWEIIFLVKIIATWCEQVVTNLEIKNLDFVTDFKHLF